MAVKEKIPTEMALQALRDVMTEFKLTLNGNGQTNFFIALTEKVNRFAKEDWTYRYIMSVANETVPPSQKFTRAIIDLAASLDSTLPDLIVRSERVSIHADLGAIHPGAFVMGRSRPCETPTCKVIFVPSHPRRRFCPVCHPPKGTK